MYMKYTVFRSCLKPSLLINILNYRMSKHKTGNNRVTTMVRVDATIRDELKKVSKNINKKMTRIVDSVLSDYLKKANRRKSSNI